MTHLDPEQEKLVEDKSLGDTLGERLAAWIGGAAVLAVLVVGCAWICAWILANFPVINW